MKALIVNGVVREVLPDERQLHSDLMVVPIPAGAVVKERMSWDGEVFSASLDLLTEEKSVAQKRVVGFAEDIFKQLTAGVPDSERLSWPLKEKAARAFEAGVATTEDTLLLQGETELTGETLAELAQTIVQKANAFRMATGKITGMRRKTVAAIKEASSLEQIAAILEAATQEAIAQKAAIFQALNPAA